MTAIPGTCLFLQPDAAGLARLAAWRRDSGRVGLELALLPGRPFRVRGMVRGLSQGLSVAFAAASGIAWKRTRSLAADGDDDLFLIGCRAGTPVLAQRARELTLQRGDAALLSHAEPFSATMAKRSSYLMLRLPRRMLSPLVPELDDAIMRPLRRGGTALRLLLGYAAAFRSRVGAGPDLDPLATAHLCDLLAMALGAEGRAAPHPEGRGVRAARLQAIKADIIERCTDHDLRLDAVAARQGVTPRYVQELLEAEGRTFSEFLLAQRLAQARRLLAEERSAGSSISAIALEAGFGDLSHFNRSFRRRYGATPSGMRAGLRALSI